jgi:hypothetical protein
MDWWLLFACVPVAFFFSVSSATACCCIGGVCTNCQTGTIPAQVEIEWSGIAPSPNIGSCADCADLNSVVFILDLNLQESNTCWYWRDDSYTCGYTRIVAWTAASSLDRYWYTQTQGVGITVVGSVLVEVGAPMDCCDPQTVDNYVDPEPTPTGFTGPCTWVDAVMTLTPVGGDCP